MHRKALLLQCFTFFLAAAPAFAADPNVNTESTIVLWNALPNASGRNANNLVLDLHAKNGQWGKVWGVAQSFNNGVHLGAIENPRVNGDTFAMTVNMDIGGDQWTDGATAIYDLEFKRKGSEIEGTYKGKFAGRDATGAITGRWRDPRPVAEGFKPVMPGEHPRLLFRKHDLPALQEKLKTPLGQAYLARITNANDPVSLGMAYQLTGDKKYASAALPIVQKWTADSDSEYLTDKGGGSGAWGHTLVQAALAYDLCHDAWPEDFKKKFESTLLEILPKLVRYVAVTSHANTHPCSNYYGPGHGAPGIVSLLFLNDKGAEPTVPPPGMERPVAKGETRGIIQPMALYTPGEGVPIVPLELGVRIDNWLFAGPLPTRGRPDVIARNTPAKIQLGVQVKYGVLKDNKPIVTTYPFAKINNDELLTDNGIDLEKALGKGPSTGLFFTVLKVEKEATVMPSFGRGEMTMLISGQTVADGELVKLAKGQHPLLVVTAGDNVNGTLGVKFSENVTTMLESVARREAQLLALDKADWRESGRDTIKQNIIDVGWRKNLMHYRWGMGEGGFQAETGPHYSWIASWYPTNYAAAYYRTHGKSASHDDDVDLLVVRRMMQVLFREDGTTSVQSINSGTRFDTKWVATAWPIVPDKYKPALLWGWNKVAGVRDESTTVNILDSKKNSLSGLEAAHAFINYPLDMKPEHPAKVMPLDWQTQTFGLHVFRSGWSSDSDFIGQVFAKSHIIKGWNHPNAGTFRLLGLGKPWVTGSDQRVGFRMQEPCVLLPDDKTNEGACGRIAYRKVEPDGSAILTLNMDDVYAAPESRLYDSNLLRWPNASVPTGITGLRAYAFDYSGKSGAPCLFVLVDKISGGGKREWLWPLPSDTLAKTTTNGNTFTIDQGDASLKATFITPGDAKPHAVGESVAVGKLGDSHRSFEGVLQRVKMTTPSGDIFVVATVQAKDAPGVKVQGEGLNAKVTVGGQTVRFDGQKIVLGE